MPPEAASSKERRAFQTEHMAWAKETFQKTLWGPRLASPSQGLPGTKALVLPDKGVMIFPPSFPSVSCPICGDFIKNTQLMARKEEAFLPSLSPP